ncbi:MAG TPA: right-handed parallel beta-helix repeat-containing protein [Anaerolineae bacterium]|nr:right-handed parallel beta-helix repeat-containing protein [Anaerolineae bacterium]
MRRLVRSSLSVLSLGLALGLAPVSAAPDQFVIFVNTTEDIATDSNHCLPGDNPCSLRGAIEKIQGAAVAGTIRACYDPATTPRGKKCPPGRKPLAVTDPGYDPATGRWTLEFGENAIPYNFTAAGTAIDFGADIVDYAGPQDNRIVIRPGASEMAYAFVVEGPGSTFKGFTLSGAYEQAAIMVRYDGFSGGARDNQFGPGLSFANINPGVGIILRDRQTIGNRFVGNWCGLEGDGSVRATVSEDCVQIMNGASRNVIGGQDLKDRNILAGSGIGSAVSVFESAPANLIVGNWIGLNAKGQPEANNGGITVKLGANNTEIIDNRISANKVAGIAIFDTTSGTVIRGNRIGLLEDGSCAGNGDVGIAINNQVFNALIEGNEISCNDKGGVSIQGAAAKSIHLRRNLFEDNDGPPINIGQGANNKIKPPQLSLASPERIIGSAPGCLGGPVEIYSDSKEQAGSYEGEVQADGATGLFIFNPSGPFKYNKVTAVCTDINNNTSAFALHRAMGSTAPTPTPTRTPFPSPTGGTPQVELRSVFIPSVLKNGRLGQ